LPHVTQLHADDPRRVGRYRLSGRIEGMPFDEPVYLARTIDGSEVTITLVGGDWVADGAARDRFTAEATAARRVAPFCAARILGAGFDGGDAFLVSDYVSGPSLREFVTEEGPWEGDDLEALAIGMATGLAAIHQAGLVHGEFGPDHVVLGVDGPRVIEYGITPPYGAATPAADLRAWAFTVLYAAAGGPAVPADLEMLPEPLRTLATECMSTGPGDRPTARSIVLELLGDTDPPAGVLGEGLRRSARAAVRPEPEPQPRPGPGPRRNPPRRAVTIWWAIGIAVCIAAIAVAVRAAQNGSSPQAATTKPVPTNQPGGRTSGSDRPRGSPGPTPTIPAALSGNWSGQVRQNSSGTTVIFDVQMSLTPGTSSGTIHYTTTSLVTQFSCADALSVVSDLASTLTLNQARINGPCQPGTVTLIPGPGSTLRYSFKGQGGTGVPPATGTLSKL
jgi:eukaryotic-like serine/threonine-protein kinase